MMAVSWFFMEIRHLLKRIKIFLSLRHQKWVLWKTKKLELNKLNVKYKVWIRKTN